MTIALSKRSLIRRYLLDALSAGVDVGGRVFFDRRSALFQDELPAINLEFGDTPAQCISGSTYRVRQYQRDLNIAIHVASAAASDPASGAADAHDFNDFLSLQVERVFMDDPTLAKRLAGYDVDSSYQGLVEGHTLLSDECRAFDDKSSRIVLVHEYHYLLPYVSAGFAGLKRSVFETYYVALTDPDADEGDPLLSEAEGTIDDG